MIRERFVMNFLFYILSFNAQGLKMYNAVSVRRNSNAKYLKEKYNNLEITLLNSTSGENKTQHNLTRENLAE